MHPGEKNSRNKRKYTTKPVNYSQKPTAEPHKLQKVSVNRSKPDGVYTFASTSAGENFEIRRSRRLTVKNNDSAGPDSQSKSVFKDIIVNYNRKIESSSDNKCNNIENSDNRCFAVNSDFSKELFIVCKYYTPKNIKAKLEKELQFEVYKCNSTIMGEPIVEMEKARNARSESPKRAPLKMQPFPRNAWVYSTPENQKIKCVHLESSRSQLQPVILRTTNRNKMLYELDERNVVFGGGCGDVVFDEVMAQPIANFSRDVDEDWARQEEGVSENENYGWKPCTRKPTPHYQCSTRKRERRQGVRLLSRNDSDFDAFDPSAAGDGFRGFEFLQNPREELHFPY